ncbi:hypothetical protein BVG19_g3706 [[Candida] boidinii]|nr:hypothetical protein BVG19_g3706 [[Candida] boidinii]OWB52510.1 cysteine-type peptidase activity protein [[Candida] boidinii]
MTTPINKRDSSLKLKSLGSLRRPVATRRSLMPINNLDTPKKSSNRNNDTNNHSTAPAINTDSQKATINSTTTTTATPTFRPSSPITRNRSRNTETDDTIQNEKRKSKRILIPTDSTSKLVEQITQEVNETLPWVSYDTSDPQIFDIKSTTNDLRKRFTNDRGRRLQGLFHKNNHDSINGLNKIVDSSKKTPSFDITEEEIQVHNNNNNNSNNDNNKINKPNQILNQTSLLKRLEFFYKDPVDKSIRRCIFRKNLEFEFTDSGIQFKTNSNISNDPSQQTSSMKNNDIILPVEQIKSIDIDKDSTINNFMIKLKNTKPFYDSVGLINQFYKIWVFFNISGKNNIENYQLIIESFKNSNLVVNFLTNDEMNDAHSISSYPIPPNAFYSSPSSSTTNDDSTVSYGSSSDSISKRMRTRSTTKLKDYTFPQLTEIQEIFENIPFENQILFKPSLKYKFEDKKSFIITNNDFKCLYNGNWVNDTIVDFFLKYYFTQATKSGKLNNLKIEVLNSFFYKKLLMDIDEENQDYYNNVRNWFKNNDNLFDQDFVIIPIMEDMHWFFVIITNLPKLKSKALKSEFDNNTDGSDSINSQIYMYSELNSSSPSPKNDDTLSSTSTNMETTPEPKRKLGRPSKNSTPKSQLQNKNSFSNKLSDEDYTKNYEENSKIYILDSLKKAHPRIYEPLRGFLRGYAKEKYNVDIPSDQIYKASCPIPQQGNFNDCGLHVVYNAAKLFWHPDLFKKLLVKPTTTLRKQLFKESERRTLRKDLRDLLLDLLKKNLELSGGDGSKICILTNGQSAENTNINGNISNNSNNSAAPAADGSKLKNGNNSDAKEDSDQETTNKKNNDNNKQNNKHYSSGGDNGTRNNLNNIEYDNSSINQNGSNETKKRDSDQDDMEEDEEEDDDELEIISENVKNSESSKNKDLKSTENTTTTTTPSSENGDSTLSSSLKSDSRASIQRPFIKTLKQKYSDHDRQLGKPSNLKNDNLIKVQYKSNGTSASSNNETTKNPSLSDGHETNATETRESNKYSLNIKSDNDTTTRVSDVEREKERQREKERIIELEKENELLKEKLREQVREMNLIARRRKAELKIAENQKESQQDENIVNDDDEEDKMEIDRPVNHKEKDIPHQGIYDQNLVDYKSPPEAITPSPSQRENAADALEVDDSQDSVLTDINQEEPSPSGIIASLESIDIVEPVGSTKKTSFGISEESAIIINTKSDEINDESNDSKSKLNNVPKSPKTEPRSPKAESKSFRRRTSPRLENSSVKFATDSKISSPPPLKYAPILINEPSEEDVTQVENNGKLQKEPKTPESTSTLSSPDSKYLDKDYLYGESSPEFKSQGSPTRQKLSKISSKRKLRHSEELAVSRMSSRLNRESRNLRLDPPTRLKFSKNSDKIDPRSSASEDHTSDLGSSKSELRSDTVFPASDDSTSRSREHDDDETDNSGYVFKDQNQQDEEEEEDDDDVTVLNEIKIPRPNGEVIREVTLSSRNNHHHGNSNSPNKKFDKRKIVFQKLPSLNVTKVFSNIVDTKPSPKSIRRNRAIGVYYSKTGSTRQYIFSNKINPISSLTEPTSVIVTSKPTSNVNGTIYDDEDNTNKIEDLSDEKEIEIKDDEIRKKPEKRIMRESGLLSRSSSDVEMNDKKNHTRVPSDSNKTNISNSSNINTNITTRKADYISENESTSKLSEDTYEPTKAFGKIESDDDEEEDGDEDDDEDDDVNQSQVVNGDIIPDSQSQSQSVPLTQSHIDSLDSSNNKNSDIMIVQETMYVSDTTDDEEAGNGDNGIDATDETYRDSRKNKRTYSGKRRGRKKKKV